MIAGELRSESGTVLAYANAVGELTAGQKTLALGFDAEEIWKNGGSGRFKLTNLTLRDMSSAGLPVQIDFKEMPYTTKSYNRNDLQHPDVYLTGVTDDYGVDTNDNGKFDELVVKAEILLETAGHYSWEARLIDGSGVELGNYSAEADFSSGKSMIEFQFDGNAIGASRRSGPYYLVDFDLWGDGGFLSTMDLAQTKAYSYRLFESSPAGADLFLPSVFR